MKILRFMLSIALVATTMTVSAAKPATFRAATYNLRQANHVDSVAGNGWGQRLPHVADLIRFHGFDIFGTQEGFKYQLDGLKKLLPGYEYIGVGRDDGKEKGEYAAIFYRPEAFQLLDSGNFWLSETPETPGLGWDARCVRVCSWGKFRDRKSGKQFIFMNLHMDHIGKTARVESAKLVHKRIKEIAGNIPAIVTGDFNVDQNSPSYNTMIKDGTLCDSYEKATITYAPTGTFNHYKPNNFTASRIDHIFVSPEIKVNKYGILTDTYRTLDGNIKDDKLKDAPTDIKGQVVTARTPSDHFPVVADLEF